MLLIFFSWCYITVVCFLFGIFVLKILSKNLGLNSFDKKLSVSLYLITGLITITVIATFYSLWMKLDIYLHLILFVNAALIVFFLKRDIKEHLSNYFLLIKSNKVLIVVFLSSVLIIDYISILNTTNTDNGLYYATYIEWIQQYHVVPGLGNLHPRLAFNSSWHIAQALFGFPFLGKSFLFDDLNGLLYLWAWLFCLGGISNLLKQKKSLSDFIKAFIFLPILPLYHGFPQIISFNFGSLTDFILINEHLISSPSADIPAMLICWIVFILFIEKIESGSVYKFDINSLIIILFSAYLITIKLSSLPILLISIFIFLNSFIKKDFKIILKIFLLNFSLLFPWLVRNIILSGYLIFPFAGIDLFNFDWKIPKRDAVFHEMIVKTWAIHFQKINFNIVYGMPLWKWFPYWYSGITFIQMIMLQIIVVSTFFYLVYIIIKSFKYGFKKYLTWFILGITNVTGILFWISKAPDFRFGYGFTIFFCVGSIAILIYFLISIHHKMIIWGIISYILYINIIYYNYVYIGLQGSALKLPLKIKVNQNLNIQKLKDGTIIYLGPGTDCSSQPIPCTPDYEPCDSLFGMNNRNVVLRGKTLQEGFKSILAIN